MDPCAGDESSRGMNAWIQHRMSRMTWWSLFGRSAPIWWYITPSLGGPRKVIGDSTLSSALTGWNWG